jgi:hypothetical protein
VSVTLLSEEENTSYYQYSRIVAPWCFDAENSIGTRYNKFFFGCAMNGTARGISEANRTMLNQIKPNLDSYISHHTDKQGVGYAVIRPAVVDSDIDWSGTSFAVSTKCSAIPHTECELGRPYDDVSLISTIRAGFECAGLNDGKNISGNFTTSLHDYWFDDWHRSMTQDTPFTSSSKWGQNQGPKLQMIDNTTIANTTAKDSNSLFRNPWHWLAQIGLSWRPWDLPPELRNNNLIWEVDGVARLFLLSCATTSRFYSATICAI